MDIQSNKKETMPRDQRTSYTFVVLLLMLISKQFALQKVKKQGQGQLLDVPSEPRRDVYLITRSPHQFSTFFASEKGQGAGFSRRQSLATSPHTTGYDKYLTRMQMMLPKERYLSIKGTFQSFPARPGLKGWRVVYLGEKYIQRVGTGQCLNIKAGRSHCLSDGLREHPLQMGLENRAENLNIAGAKLRF